MNKTNFFLKLSVLALLLSGCSKDELKPVITDTYEATIYIFTSNTISGIGPVEYFDTIRFDIKIDTSLQIFQDGPCTGEAKFDSEKVSFYSEECACWCNCDPRIDCSGHPILGAYDLVASGDTLFLNYEYELIDSVSFENYVFNYSSTRNISLIKK